MRDEDAFGQSLLDVETETEDEADAALVASLHLALRRSYDADARCWRGRDIRDSVRRTCHAVEVLQHLTLDDESAHILEDATHWLASVGQATDIHPMDRAWVRRYPSRFKTLAYLGRFGDDALRSDFQDVLAREHRGMIRGVVESDMLATCIALDTLLTLESAGIRETVCTDERYDAIVGAVRRQYRRWLRTVAPEIAAAGAGAEDSEGAPAPRRYDPQCEIDGLRSLSYAWGLLHHVGRGTIAQRHVARTSTFLAAPLTRPGMLLSSDVLQALYAALQLVEHRRRDGEIQDVLRRLRSELRHAYTTREVTKHWDFVHHTLVMRLYITQHGDVALARNVTSCLFKGAERRHAARGSTVQAELRDIIRERIEIRFGDIEELTGGYSDAQVLRVPFTYRYPVPGEPDGERDLDQTHHSSLIVKRSAIDGFHVATENYRLLPEPMREYFVRQPAESQVYKSGLSSSHYLVMEDLAEFTRLEQLVDRFDRGHLSEDEASLVMRSSTGICDTVFTVFRHARMERSGLPGTHIARLYLSPVEGKLLRAIRAVPWLKSVLKGYTANGQRYRDIEYYLSIVAKHAQDLQPRYLGIVHGDLHARNVMLDAECSRVRLIDLDKLSATGDYLADLGNLLVDVCVCRRVAQPEAAYGLGADEIQFVTARGEIGTAENAVVYPALGRPATVAFQRTMLDQIAAFAAGEDVRDSGWRPRLWLACASGLLVRLAFERRKERAALLYGEAVRLLNELCRHLESGTALHALVVPDVWQRAPERVGGAQMPEWIRRSATLRGIHEALAKLPLRVAINHATITYSAAGASARPVAKLVTPGREGIGRLLLATDVAASSQPTPLKVVEHGREGGAFGNIVILNEATQAEHVAALVRASMGGPQP